MEFHDFLEDILGSPSKIRILRFLVKSKRREFTGREISKAAGVSPPRTIEILNAFEDFGLVQSRSAGRSVLWNLNPHSRIVRDILAPMFKKEEGFLEEAKAKIWKSIKDLSKEAILFGSAARVEEGAAGDLDVFIKVKNERARKEVLARIDEIQMEMIRQFNIVVSPLVYTEKEAREKEGSELMREIRQGERICA
jgi:predicted nucleotidyltransferase